MLSIVNRIVVNNVSRTRIVNMKCPKLIGKGGQSLCFYVLYNLFISVRRSYRKFMPVDISHKED